MSEVLPFGAALSCVSSSDMLLSSSQFQVFAHSNTSLTNAEN
jgi:hypothetical protein